MDSRELAATATAAVNGYAALLAALDALVAENIEVEDPACWCRVCEDEWNFGNRPTHAPECPIGKLAAELATHQPPRIQT
jgi:hypothetical protein